jgi:hypothetical protein
VFTDPVGSLPPFCERTFALAAGDVDGDLDLDVVMASAGRSRIYTNLTRQLAWRNLPRVGKPLSLDVAGPANGIFALAFSLAETRMALPPLGTFRLDLRWFTTFASGPLDAAGRAAVTIAVPSDPNLLGVPVFSQAVVGVPLALTNLEILRFTPF